MNEEIPKWKRQYMGLTKEQVVDLLEKDIEEVDVDDMKWDIHDHLDVLKLYKFIVENMK